MAEVFEISRSEFERLFEYGNLYKCRSMSGDVDAETDSEYVLVRLWAKYGYMTSLPVVGFGYSDYNQVMRAAEMSESDDSWYLRLCDDDAHPLVYEYEIWHIVDDVEVRTMERARVEGYGDGFTDTVDFDVMDYDQNFYDLYAILVTDENDDVVQEFGFVDEGEYREKLDYLTEWARTHAKHGPELSRFEECELWCGGEQYTARCCVTYQYVSVVDND